MTAFAADPYRPVYHFTPEKNWMNDPNGLVYFQGEYHLFYQYNPFGDTWGHMSWGHAVSRDLVRWEHLPVAIPEADGIMIFSGSAVVDWKNSSGLCRPSEPCLIAIYTGHTPQRQHQNLAFSHDRGRTWTKYQGNPVLDIGLKDFRDPKVFWHAKTKSWIMLAALPVEKKVRFYASPDLKKWTALSDFGPAGATGGIWECPDLFELDGHWVLVVNLNPGAPAGGSGGQYFIGRFDGKEFRAEHSDIRWIDYGRDLYATVSFSDTPGRRIWLGWMSNWQNAQHEPTSPWRTAQSVPRELKLKRIGSELRLLQQPVRELERHRVSAKLPDFRGDSYELEAQVSEGGGFLIRKGAQEHTTIGVRRGEIFIDRTRSGAVDFHKTFPGIHAAPVDSSKPVRLRILVDRSSVEVFAGAGEIVLTDRIFPSVESTGVEVYGQVSGLRLWRLILQ